MKFHPLIEKALEEKGIYQLTPMQRRAIDDIMNGKNLLLISPTGSGKTEAAMLPIFQKIISKRYEKISTIYITPLRALNRDLMKRLKFFGEKLNISIEVRHGDTPSSKRRKIALNPPDVLITTPETFQILFTGRRLREGIKNVKFVIIDEVHELSSDERGAQLSVGLERLRNFTDFQIIGLSATVGNSDDIGKFLSPSEDIEIVKIPVFKKIDVKINSPERNYVEESSIMGCDIDYASSLLEMLRIMEEHRGILLFVNTRATAEDIGMRYNLLKRDLPVAVHHGSLSRDSRVEAEERFKSGEIKMLICTSSLELGIDVGLVDIVMQYNSPRQVIKLIQRVGRAGHRINEISRGIIISHNPVEIWESSVILSLARRGWVENVRIRKEPLIVLFNQIVAMANSERKMNIKFAYDTIRRAYPFRNLEFEKFLQVLNFAKSTGKIWADGINFGARRGGFNYFYENISMIPDEKSYRVISREGKFIGILDERFVSSLKIGETFVIGGKTWRIMDIRESKVIVEYIRDVALPPSWLGEEIPVPYEIASGIPDFENLNENAKNILEKWKIDWNEKRVVIERGKGLIFVGIRGGTRANYTLALIISSIFSQKIGESVEFSNSPYGFALFNPHIKTGDLKTLLLTLNGIERIAKIVVKNSRIFRYVFVHVARKMGIIRKDADLKKLNIEKIADSYRNTPVYEETLNKILWDYMDIENAEKILKNVKKAEIVERELSDAARILLESKGDMASPIIATRPILEAIYNRLLNEEMVLLCLSCGRSMKIKVKDFKKPICPFCGSVRVVLLKPYEEKIVEKIKRGKINEMGKRELDRLAGVSHLLRTHKKIGAMVLAGRGIGLSTAARILEVPYEDELEVVKRILREELKYAKNRQFWD